MITFIENIGIAFILAVILTFVAYFLASKIKRELSVPHYVGLGILFLLLSYQSYRFMNAWDEKNAIEEVIESLNSMKDDAIDLINEDANRNGVARQFDEQFKEIMNNPFVQLSLKLYGIDISDDGKMTVEMGEKLKSEYNWYMFRRVCWILGFMAVFLIVSTVLPEGSSAGYRQRTSDRGGRHTSRPQRRSTRRR